MLYGEELHVLDNAIGDAQLATAIALEAATGAKFSKTMVVPCTPLYFGFFVTVTFAYDTQTTEGIITLYKYPLGVSGSKISLGTMRLVNGYLQYHSYMIAVSQVPPNVVPTVRAYADCNVGDVLAIEVTTQGAGGQAIAGDYQPFVIIQHRGENDANQTGLHIVTS